MKIKSVLMFLAICISSTILVPNAFAGSYSGTIVKNERGLFLISQTVGSLLIPIAQQSVYNSQELARLHSGDWCAGSGTFDGLSLTIESVDVVGLQDLLGKWDTSLGGVVEFSDFTNMHSFATPQNADSRLGTSFKYTISPNPNGDWSIFFGNTSTAQIGILQNKLNGWTLSLLNSADGSVSQIIELTPFNSRGHLKR